MAKFSKMSKRQLERYIRATCRNTALIFITRHASQRMAQRSVLAVEVYHCLQTGILNQEPEEDLKTGHLVCRMECFNAGRNLMVCVALDDEDPAVIVVTVIVK